MPASSSTCHRWDQKPSQLQRFIARRDLGEFYAGINDVNPFTSFRKNLNICNKIN